MPRIDRFPRTLAALAVAGAALLACPAFGAQLEYRSVDFPGATATEVFAVNDLRQYVGAEREADGSHYALLDQGAGFQRLDLTALGTHQSWAYSINSKTDVCGTFIDADGQQHGYVHHADGSIETIDFPGGNNTQGYGVNDRGTVIGVYNDGSGVSHAFARIKGRFMDIDIPGGIATTPLSVNDSNEIVGQFEKNAGTTGYGFVRDAKGHVTLHQAPGSLPESTFFISANNRGGVLGAWVDADGNDVNFLRKQAKYYPVGLPASFEASFTSAQTINDRSDIVGYYVGPDGAVHGWLGWAKNSGLGK